MGKLWVFVKAVCGELWALLSCAIFTGIGVWQAFFEKGSHWIIQASFSAAAILLVVAMFLAWLRVYNDLEALRRKHEQPEIELRYDDGQQTFVLRNNGGDAHKVRVLFRQHPNYHLAILNEIPKLSANSFIKVGVVVKTARKEGNKLLWDDPPPGPSKLLQMCGVIFGQPDCSSTTSETIRVRYQDYDADEYESECRLNFNETTGAADMALVRSQRYKPDPAMMRILNRL